MNRAKGTIYQSSDRRFFGDTEVWERFECGDWAPCCWDADIGTEWVETMDGDLLELRPVAADALPATVRITSQPDGAWVTDTASSRADLWRSRRK